MCHGNFTYWASFYNEATGTYTHLSRYISKSGLWEDIKAAGATPAQMRAMKEQMKQAPTKRMYTGR